MKKILEQLVQQSKKTDFSCMSTQTRDGKDVVILYHEPFTTAVAVVEDNGKLNKVGRAEFVFKDKNKTLYLRMIKIEEDFRNQGIGSAMMNNLVEYACQKQCERIELIAAKRLCQFYQNLGFSCTGKTRTGFSVMDLTELAKTNRYSV